MLNGRYVPESDKPMTWARRYLNGLSDGIAGRVLDVGAGRAKWTLPGITELVRWDQEQGDAHRLPGVKLSSFDALYAGHVLEHLQHPTLALTTWLYAVRPGGHLLLSVPHRDLYEKRAQLPSQWNRHHVRFYLPDRGEPPHTVGLLPWLNSRRLEQPSFQVLAVQTGDWGYRRNGPNHPEGEYCIDALLQRI